MGSAFSVNEVFPTTTLHLVVMKVITMMISPFKIQSNDKLNSIITARNGYGDGESNFYGEALIISCSFDMQNKLTGKLEGL